MHDSSTDQAYTCLLYTSSTVILNNVCSKLPENWYFLYKNYYYLRYFKIITKSDREFNSEQFCVQNFIEKWIWRLDGKQFLCLLLLKIITGKLRFYYPCHLFFFSISQMIIQCLLEFFCILFKMNIPVSGNSPYVLRFRASSGVYLRITSAFASW